jgi:hypothetical protein
MSQEFTPEHRIEIIRRCSYLLTHYGRLFGRAQGSSIFYYRAEGLQATEFRPTNAHKPRTIKLHALEASTSPGNEVTSSILYLQGDDPYLAEWSNLEQAQDCLLVLRRHMVLEDLASL